MRRRPGACPLCGARVATPALLEGIWTGAKPPGTPAGGGIHAARCRACRAGLVASSDLYDESGRLRAVADEDLTWRLRGVPWQTIGLVVAALAAVGGLVLWWRGA